MGVPKLDEGGYMNVKDEWPSTPIDGTEESPNSPGKR